ncbi:unnamed protein product [Cuscuta campestris]|uniref:Tobamovirus multiplication protein 2A n=1 Tax=Cuscuta campestris TaxID=132261 RepID=A0A484KEF8_9ASTE|nr:unnamed protein product [Cuscuta campestris]
MACKGFFECLLKLMNFFLTLIGLAMIGYGVYLFVEYKNHSSSVHGGLMDAPGYEVVQLGRPMLMAVSLGDNIFDKLPNAWFIYLFIAVGIVICVISCIGCIGGATRNGCCLSCYSVLIMLLILLELGIAAFIFFDKSWKKEIPTDKTGNFDMIYKFLEEHWDIVRWAALGAVVLEALIFLLAIVVRAVNAPADYDSDDEYIGVSRQQIRQPLISNRQPAPAPSAPAAATIDSRPSTRSDAWSTRMREKYGLDTSEFTYNPSESNRYQQTPVQPQEESSRCAIM